MINCTAIDEKLSKDVLDGKAVRRMYKGSNQHVVLAKIKIKGRCKYGS